MIIKFDNIRKKKPKRSLAKKTPVIELKNLRIENKIVWNFVESQGQLIFE
jgi:hypothetical protein